MALISDYYFIVFNENTTTQSYSLSILQIKLHKFKALINIKE